jgi:hypothetical protein
MTPSPSVDPQTTSNRSASQARLSSSPETKRENTTPTPDHNSVSIGETNVASSSSSSSSSAAAKTIFEQFTGCKKHVVWNKNVAGFSINTPGVDIIFRCSDEVRCGFSKFMMSTGESSVWKATLAELAKESVIRAEDYPSGIMGVIRVEDYPSGIMCNIFEWLTTRPLNSEIWIKNAISGWGIPEYDWLYVLGCCAYQHDIMSLYECIVRYMILSPPAWSSNLDRFMQKTTLSIVVKTKLATLATISNGPVQSLAEMQIAAVLHMQAICSKHAVGPGSQKPELLRAVCQIQTKELEAILAKTTEKLSPIVYRTICTCIGGVATKQLTEELAKTAIGKLHVGGLSNTYSIKQQQ